MPVGFFQKDYIWFDYLCQLVAIVDKTFSFTVAVSGQILHPVISLILMVFSSFLDIFNSIGHCLFSSSNTFILLFLKQNIGGEITPVQWVNIGGIYDFYMLCYLLGFILKNVSVCLVFLNDIKSNLNTIVGFLQLIIILIYITDDDYVIVQFMYFGGWDLTNDEVVIL